MNKLITWGIAIVIGVLICGGIWFAYLEDRNEPLNQADAFVYSEDGKLYWFQLTNKHGDVTGKFHQQELIEEVGEVPVIIKKQSAVSGEKTETGYLFHITKGGKTKTYHAWFSEEKLAVKPQGEDKVVTYKAVDKEELSKDKQKLDQELETAIYYAEEKEKNRLRKFFEEFRSAYGYFSEGGSYLLFLKINEAFLQGEVSGTLLMLSATGNEAVPYEETTYDVNGITDGLMIQLFTTIDGKTKKLEGNFGKTNTEFDSTFWKEDDKIHFAAITEVEYQQRYAEFKQKVANN